MVPSLFDDSNITQKPIINFRALRTNNRTLMPILENLVSRIARLYEIGLVKS